MDLENRIWHLKTTMMPCRSIVRSAIKKTSATSYINLGQYYDDRGKYDEALKLFKEGFKCTETRAIRTKTLMRFI